MPSQTCLRCGFVWEISLSRNNPENCESCRTTKKNRIRECIVWHGHFAADFVTPIDENGVEVMPGIRTCGNKDCVNVSHIAKLK